MEKKNIGVVFGGRSGEHEISIRSATTVLREIDREKYDVIPIAIDKQGKWLNPGESLKYLPGDVRKLDFPALDSFDESDVALLGDTSYQGLTRLAARGEKRSVKLDAVFPVLHGTFGEDGTIQGLFEMCGIPYLGCGVLASSCGMDKVVMKTLFRDAGLPICEYRLVSQE